MISSCSEAFFGCSIAGNQRANFEGSRIQERTHRRVGTALRGHTPANLKREAKQRGAQGNVSGHYSDSTGNHGFITARGAFIPLDDPEANTLFGGGVFGPATFAFGHNDGGQAAAYYLADGFLSRPCSDPRLNGCARTHA
jgi:hypothetical protein